MTKIADIENAVGHGEGQYEMLNVLAYYDGDKLEDVLVHTLDFEYGLYQDGEVSGYLYTNPDSDKTIYNVNLKHKFLEENDWTVSGLVRYAYRKDDYKTPSIRLLTNKKLNSNLILHNNLRLYFYESDNIGKSIENGLTYKIDNKNTLKFEVFNHTYDELSDFAYHDIKAGVQSLIDEKTTYTGYVYTRINDNDTDDNILFANSIEYQVEPGLTLTGNIDINTDESNEIYGKIEKELAYNITISGEYFNILDEDIQRFHAKVKKELENGLYVFGRYNNDLDNEYGLNLGVGFEL